MKKADKAAIDAVRSKTEQNFAQHVFFVQNNQPERWTHIWRSVRLRCPVCEDGYLRPSRATKIKPTCVECNATPLLRKPFWVEKAKIALALVANEDQGELWPYILVEIRDRVPA